MCVFDKRKSDERHRQSDYPKTRIPFALISVSSLMISKSSEESFVAHRTGAISPHAARRGSFSMRPTTAPGVRQPGGEMLRRLTTFFFKAKAGEC
jgi:hypothetical protein